MALQFTRNASVFVELEGVQTWKLSVLDGFSFTQSINSSEITINEAGSTSRRARLLFNDSLAPVEWSLSTYARPFEENSSQVRCPEEPLWAMMLGANAYSSGVFSRSTFTAVTGIDVHTATLQANGPEYEITTQGTTNWTSIGALSDVVGTKFIYNGEPITGAGGEVTETAAINTLTNDGDENPGDENIFNLSKSNVSSFSDGWNMYFAFEDGSNTQYYKLASAVVNSVSIDFDIDGIATISWSGFAKNLTDEGTDKTLISGTPLASPREEGLTSTTNFIRNRVSTVDLSRIDKFIGNVDPLLNEASSPASDIRDVYQLVLTGGSFTIENNINYLTPEELGVVNAPLANITGARSVSGSLTCYLDNDKTNSKSGELFADLVSDTDTIRNVFDMAVNIGGVAESTPRLVFDLPTAHLEIPTINVEDLLTLEVNFHGQVQGGDVDLANEATIRYKA